MPHLYAEIKRHQKGSGCNIAIFALAAMVWGGYEFFKPLLDILF